MIVVAGGTGTLGTYIVRGLTERGLDVRVITRDRRRADHLAGDRVEVVEGDVRDRPAMTAAVGGAGVVVSAVHGFAGPGRVSPTSIDRDGNRNLVDAAALAGADVVLLSVVGAAAASPMELFRMKAAAEQHLAASAATGAVVRATAFMDTWIALLEETASKSGRPLVFGRGASPINLVAARDVAAVVIQSVVEPAWREQTIEVAGPEELTFDELAAKVQRSAGRAGPPRHVPRGVLRAMTALAPIRPELARQARAALELDAAGYPTPATSPDGPVRLRMATTTVDDLLLERAQPGGPPAPGTT